MTERGLVVVPDESDKIGARPGDRVVVNLRSAVRVKSMVGFGVRPGAKSFTDEDLPSRPNGSVLPTTIVWLTFTRRDDRAP